MNVTCDNWHGSMNNPVSLHIEIMTAYIEIVALAVLEMPRFCFVVERRGKLSGHHGVFIHFSLGSIKNSSQNVVT